MNIKRIFLIVLDSVGIGELPDAKDYGDVGSNTIKACFDTGKLNIPNMKRLGLFNIDGVDYGSKQNDPIGCYARMSEKSRGKDTTIGHWEISGIISENPLPTYPDGFPEEIISEFEEKTGRKVLCNRPYSGTKVIEDYGKRHVESGDLIVYTSADSVFQIAAHEDVVSVEELYKYCEIARGILNGKHGVGRVIARPFVGSFPEYKRTSNRHDFSLEPPKDTMLDILSKNNLDVVGVGKIYDIFAGRGLTEYIRTKNNQDGIEKIIEYLEKDFTGLCFVNLVDFDMLYGHRNDVTGYTNALNEFDSKLEIILNKLKDDDILMITADHGCDPTTKSTDHSREYTPLLVYGKKIKKNINLNNRESFADIAKTIIDIMNCNTNNSLQGDSFKDNII